MEPLSDTITYLVIYIMSKVILQLILSACSNTIFHYLIFYIIFPFVTTGYADSLIVHLHYFLPFGKIFHPILKKKQVLTNRPIKRTLIYTI